MTVIETANGQYTGLAADTKPTSGIPNGSTFIETNTGVSYVWNGTVWNNVAAGAFAYTIYKVGTTYYAKNGKTGAIDYSGTVPETVIQNALTASGSIYIAAGQYTLSAGFSAFIVGINNHIKMDRNAILSVPAGYTGAVFQLNRRVQGVIIEGGWINDPTLPTNRASNNSTPGTYVGLYFNCVGAPACGQSFNIFKDIYIENAAIGISFNIDNANGDYYSSNSFRDITLMTPNIGVQFVGPVSECLFSHVIIEAAANCTNGWKDIRGGFNIFEQCFVWDIQNNPAAVMANITVNNSQPNMILGGLMTGQNFSDLAPAPNRTIRYGGYDNIISAPDAPLTIGGITVTDAKNIILGTTTGTKIGTSTTQKLGFYNATPITQQANTAGAITAGATYTASEQKMLTDAYTVLRNLGLLS